MFDEQGYITETFCLLVGRLSSGHRTNQETDEGSLYRPFMHNPVSRRVWVLTVIFSVVVLLGLLSSPAAAQCSPPECSYPAPTVPAIVEEEGVVEEPVAAPPWDGYTDGRLNPQQGEYYTIYCQGDFIHVVRAVPETETLAQIMIISVQSMSIGETLNLGDFMSLVRNTEDTSTIYGSNGNLAPQPGEKAFSLSECVARNSELSNDEPEAEEPHENPLKPTDPDTGTCNPGSPESWDYRCVPDSSLEILWQFIYSCLPVTTTMFVLPGTFVLRSRRKNSRRFVI